MSAPVMRCGIYRSAARIQITTTPVKSDTLALAVPDALWDDDSFHAAVARRFWRDSMAHGKGIGNAIRAVNAELRARAGVPESGFGNPGGAA